MSTDIPRHITNLSQTERVIALLLLIFTGPWGVHSVYVDGLTRSRFFMISSSLTVGLLCIATMLQPKAFFDSSMQNVIKVLHIASALCALWYLVLFIKDMVKIYGSRKYNQYDENNV